MGKTTTSKISVFIGLFLSTATVLVAFQSMAIDVTVNDITHLPCGDTDTGAVELFISGGTAPYTYTLTQPDGTSSAPGLLTENSASIFFDSLTAGDYVFDAEDFNGTPATKPFTIEYQDQTPPEAIARDIEIFLDANGEANITAQDIDDNSSDNCTLPENLDFELDIYNFHCTNIGENTVTMTVTDEAGNSSSSMAVVKVTDSIAPVAVARDITVTLDASGEATITAQDIDNNSSDNCTLPENLDFALDIYSFDCTNIGENTVTLTVTDEAGNPSSITAVVTVEDTRTPEAVANPYTLTLGAGGTAKVSAQQIGGASTGPCGMQYLIEKIDQPEVPAEEIEFVCADLPEGSREKYVFDVKLTVTDANGNQASVDTTSVTVYENINFEGDEPVTLANPDNNCEVDQDLTAVTALGNCSSNEYAVTGTRSDGEALDAPFPVGVTTITWSTGGENPQSVKQEITVKEDEKPVVTAPDPQTLYVPADKCEAPTDAIIGPEYTDNCRILSVEHDAGATLPVGEHTVTWTVTDESGNPESVEQQVTVVDEEGPVPPVLEDIETSCEITVEPPVIDDCGREITGTADRELTFYPQNGYSEETITWTFEDIYGNISEATQIVKINPLIATFEAHDVSCDDGSEDGYVVIDASGGKPDYSYAVNNGPFGSESTIWNLAEGTHTAKVKDAYGCIYEEEITIGAPETIVFTPDDPNDYASTTPVSCFGISDGSITVDGNFEGGSGEYEYFVNGVYHGTSPILEGLPAGEHEVTVEDSNECGWTGFIPVTITGPDQLQASVNKTADATCFGQGNGEIKVSTPSGGNGTDYKFKVNDEAWTGSSSGHTFTNLFAGEYDVYMMEGTVGAEGFCERFLTTITINQPSELQANVTTTRTTSYGSATGTAKADPTGGNQIETFEWWDSAGNLVGNTQEITGLPSGTYTVKVTDSEGCFAIEEFEIYDILTADIVDTSGCVNDDDEIRTSYFSIDPDLILGGKGNVNNYTYEWDFGSEISDPLKTGMGTFTVNYPTTGDKIIYLTITDDAGNGTPKEFTFYHYVGSCEEECKSSSNFSGDEKSFYIGDSTGDKILNGCDNNNDMYLYFVVNNNANAYKLYTRITYTVTKGSTTQEYTVENCYSNGDTTIQDGDIIQLNKVGPELGEIHWECDQTLSIQHITYKWTNQKDQSCEQTKQNMCSSSNEFIPVATPIRAEVEQNINTCYGENTGSIIINASGGSGSFTYLAVKDLEDGETQQQEWTSTNGSISNLPAGTYTITVTDRKEVADGQEKAYYTLPEKITITQPSEPLVAEIDEEVTQNLTCYRSNDGVAGVSVTGGAGDYTYSWNDPERQKTRIASGLRAAVYTVSISDANGCTLTKEVEITQPPETTQAIAGVNQTKCGFRSTNLQGNSPGVGETGNWSIEEGTGGTLADLNDPKSEFSGDPGTYVLRWTITGPGCDSFEEVSINIIEDCKFLDFDGIDDYINMEDNGEFNFDTGSFSIEAWVKKESNSTNNKTILSKKGSSRGYELIIASNGAPEFRWGTYKTTKTLQIGTQRWYHIAVTYDEPSSTLRLYVDGIPIETRGSVNNPLSTTAPFLIGATFNSNPDINSYTKASTHFNGWIEEVRLWKTALTTEQLRFMMNQRLINNNGTVRGEELPVDVPGSLSWDSLKGYYRLLADEAATGTGFTIDRAGVNIDGELKNMEDFQENTAPLPYISIKGGFWPNINSTESPWLYNQGRWDAPNSNGITGDPIEWNIARISHDIQSGDKNITLLGLISENRKLTISNPDVDKNENNPGHSLRVSHYLKLDGKIDLVGESQLLQDEGSILDESSVGEIKRDQQGTASSFNYNYWSSPVSNPGSTVNAGYTIGGVIRDGTASNNPFEIDFNYRYAHADGTLTTPIKISTYWLNKFYGTADAYSEWKQIGKDGHLDAGQGFTMKGSQNVAVTSGLKQNYSFKGMPHNGTISLNMATGTNYLIGNPYPSAIDADEFIKDNLAKRRDGKNIFNGSLYFWSHFSGQTHYLSKYIGGYATYNLAGGVRAVANDERINATGSSGGEKPERYIPVGQAFFVNTELDEAIENWNADNPQPITIDGGDILFKNSQRVFKRESVAGDESIFHKPETKSKQEIEKKEGETDKRMKIWLRFDSPLGYHRQVLATADPETTYSFDMGYDAPLNDNVDEDLYWMMQKTKFVIQGVPDFNKERELPLGIKLKEEGQFSIAIDEVKNIPDDFAILIKDSIKGETHDLRNSSFKFTAGPGNIHDRFSVVFLNEKNELIKGKEEKDPVLENLDLYYSIKDSEITILNQDLIPIKKAYLYSINGQHIKTFSPIPTENTVKLFIPLKINGVYILKLETENGSKSLKFIIG